jgi:protein required for attachment to host cells
MVSKRSETWVVVADGMRARILRWEGGDRFGQAMDHDLYDAAVHGFSRDLKSDAPGRAFDPGSGARHAIEPRHDPHEQEKVRFGGQVASVLDDAAARQAFDRLILVAPPKALGILRAALSERVRKCVTGEVNKDLVRTPVHELASHLRDSLGG